VKIRYFSLVALLPSGYGELPQQHTYSNNHQQTFIYRCNTQKELVDFGAGLPGLTA
jgi:hypothetical protein